MNRYKQRIGKLVKALQAGRVRAMLWWWQNDRRYGLWWRSANCLAALLIICSVVIPIASEMWQRDQYKLSMDAMSLVGQTDSSLSSQLKYDAQIQTYEFNKDAIVTSGLPSKLQQASVGATNKSNTKAYSLDVPTDISKGVTYHDTNSQLGFSMVPKFSGMDAKTEQGHIVFPLEGGNQAVYTLKNNGLKEDIVVPKVTADTMKFSYQLKLPKTLEAKVIPDSGGAIGLYSADSALFGDINYSSPADQKRVEDARVKGPKTVLVFGLPAPVIKTVDDKQAGNASARFELSGNTLSVIAENLKSAKAPISIDPSVVVTSTSDFQTGGNNEGNNIDFSTTGQITRGGLSGGSNSGGWTTNSDTTPYSIRYGHAVLVYDGYIYVVGGLGPSNVLQNDVTYATLNSNGTIGTWTTTSSFTTARMYQAAVAYNGYMYLYGGYASGSNAQSDVQYAVINSNGTLGAWVTNSTSMNTGVCRFGYAVYEGYLYATGGANATSGQCGNTSTPLTTVQYAPLNADGTVGTWSTTTAFTTARHSHQTLIYNGFIYVISGTVNGTGGLTDVQYAPVNADGTVGTWSTTTALASARYRFGATMYKGYLYIDGGVGGNYGNDLTYAQINANGTLGTWQTGTPFTTARWGNGLVTNSGYIYVIGGSSVGGSLNDNQYSKIDTAGQTVAFGTLSNNFSTARALSCSVAYNGYLYNIGGSTIDSTTNNSAVVQYTALNSSGGNGAWSAATSLPAGRGSSGCVAYNGFLYVVAGYTGTSVNSTAVLYTAINSDGTLGASWTTSGNALNTALVRPGVFAYGNSNGVYLYTIGGSCVSAGDSTCTDAEYAPITLSTGAVGTWTTSTNLLTQYWGYRAYAMVGNYIYAYGGSKTAGGVAVTNQAEYTSVNSNGTLAAWQSTTAMSTSIGYAGGTTINGCIYQVGGESGGTSLSTVQYACPAANGSISAWNTAPSLTLATTDLGVTSYAGYIYGVGGWSTTARTTTQYAYVNNGGSGLVGSWTTQSSTTFTCAGTADYAVAVYNGYLYAAGGRCSGIDSTTVRYAPINANGSIGSWTSTSAMQTPRTLFGLVTNNGYLYAISGYHGGENTTSEYAAINANGTLGSWGYLTGNVPTAHDTFATAVWNGHIYTLGGDPGETEVAYATPGSNGDITSWSTTTSLPANTYAGSAVAYNGYLYIVGGDGSLTTDPQQVLYAPINSNGTLGSWTQTSWLNASQGGTAVVASNGFLYVLGGYVGNALSTVAYAPITATGAVGAWKSGVPLTNASGGGGSSTQTAVAWGGNIYKFSPSNADDAYQYGTQSSIARTARYSKIIDLSALKQVSSITYNGSSFAGQVGISFRTAGANGAFSSTIGSAAGIVSTTCTSSVSSVRYVQVIVTLDDTTTAVQNDANTATANLTDFTVNYLYGTPPPNIRLRLGQTLQAGDLSPLDTCKS